MQAITADTRSAKTKIPTAELRSKWRDEAGMELETIRGVIANAAGQRRAAHIWDAPTALASAEAHLFERRSVVDERDLLREALRAGQGEVDLPAVRSEMAKKLAEGSLLRVGAEIASRAALVAEQAFVAWAHANRHACPPLGIAGDDAGLEADQRTAVAQILAARGRVVILQGDAGTGKTTSLRAIVAGIERAGGQVFGCAPSAGATDVLRKELTPTADTLQQWLVNESLRVSTRGRALLVDEAGLVSVPQMLALCRFADANNNRLVLVGDIKQHHSVEAGDALRCLQNYAHVPVARLVHIRRQRNPAYREAVAALARGDTFDAFNRFERLGAVQEIRKESALFDAAARDYVQTIAAGKKCLAISPVWEEIFAFTDQVRAQLKAAGMLGRDEHVFQVVSPLHWTREERRRIQNYQTGDALVFHRAIAGFLKGEMAIVLWRDDRFLRLQHPNGSERWIDPRNVSGFEVCVRRELGVAVGERLLIRANAKAHGLKNGDLVEIAGFGEDGAIRLKDGRRLPLSFREYAHGYATTSHAAQGKTAHRGILIMGEAALVAADMKQAYVSNSRFQESQMIYTIDCDTAREAMMRPGDRKLATEAVESIDTSAHEAAWQGLSAASRVGAGGTR